MMSRIKSRGVAKLKLLLIVPMAALLLLAFAEPKAADIPVEDKAMLSADQDTDQIKEKDLQKKMEKIKAQLMDLKKEEMILREKMDATEDPKKRAEIKAHLKDVLTKEKVLAEALQNGELPPPPKAPTPPPPPPPAAKDKKMLQKEYQLLSKKAEALRAKMEKVTDAKEKSELKAALVDVMKKQEKIESYLDGSNGANGIDAKLDELKKEYIMLDGKAEECRKKMKSTDDPDVKAKCKQMLSEIQEKQQKIKEITESLKNAKEGKTIK